MIIQIYTFQTEEEAVQAHQAGVQHIGLTPTNQNLPGEITCEKARQICLALPETAVKTALTISDDQEEILQMVNIVQPDILHLCGPIYSISPQGVADLRKLLPAGTRIMQAIPVGTSREAVQIALEYETVSDILLLDSVTPEIDGIGASGATHDWTISREIVQKCKKPVILAGGLSPQNVAEAVRVVRPAGVDSLTHTNHDLGNGKFRKDLDKIREFIKQAKLAENE